MPIHYVYYDLQDGFIHHWLAGGPQAIPVSHLDHYTDESFKQQVARRYYEESIGITEMPVERGPLTGEGTFKVGDYEGSWSYVRCREDHFVDHTAFYPTCHYLRSWAYAQIASEKAQTATLVLTTHGPADVWLNGQHVQRQEHFYDRRPGHVPFGATLKEGINEILVRFEGVGVRECPHAMALQVRGSTDQPAAEIVRVRLPTTIRQLARRETLEKVFNAAYLEQDVFGRDEVITVRWPDDLGVSAETNVRFQTPSGRIYAEAYVQGSAGDHATLDYAYKVPGGPYQIILMPRPREYYEDNVRITRELCVWTLGNNPYSETPYGTYEERRQEALAHAAQHGGSLSSEIAKMALGQWSAVETDVVMQTIEGINRREDGSDLYLVELLGMLYRFGDNPEFPESLRQPLEDCILNFKYWHDEPGSDVMCYTSESRSILFHTCEILAGQLYPARTFSNSGETGRWHREKGERLALEWLRERGATGFKDWDSNSSFAHHLVALSHLVDLAETEQIWEMAAVLMDKTFLTIALNSYKGVFGSTHGRTRASFVKGGLLEPTAGIARLMWGTGIFNHHVEGSVSLACTENYELPTIISDIATSLPEEMWNRERHVVGGGKEVNKVTYRTPDYMLCSAQDYYPGEEGYQEHIWEATMGPAAVVFATHPPCACEDDARGPNFWLGNTILPRVAQWKDVLIAIHNLPEDDWMGFTHAYFPIHAFEEYALRDDAHGHPWAFAKKGDGYLALTASQGLSLIRQGHSAYRELRSYGPHNVWLCHMGRATLDSDFGMFQEKVLALDVAFSGLSVRCETLRGETLSFSCQGPLLRNGQEQPLAGFKHYENPYCVAGLPSVRMEVRSDAYLLRLNFRLSGPKV